MISTKSLITASAISLAFVFSRVANRVVAEQPAPSTKPAAAKPAEPATSTLASPKPAAPAETAATKPAQTQPAAPSEDDEYERAIELIADVRKNESWLDKVKSIRIQATGVWTATKEGKAALANEPSRLMASRTLSLPLFLELLPRIEEKIEVAWDEKRVARLEEFIGTQRVRWVFDGTTAVKQINVLVTGREQNVLDKSPERLVSSYVMEPFYFGRSDARKAWWAPEVPDNVAKAAQDAMAQYKFLRSEKFNGRTHHVIGAIENEWWIDAETKRLAMLRLLKTMQPPVQDRKAIQETTWAFLRSQGYDVKNAADESRLTARLNRESPQIYAVLQRAITEEMIRKGVVHQYVVDEYQLLDYTQVAPGQWWPKRQIARYNSALPGREGLPILQREVTTTRIEIDKTVPDDVFAVVYTEGARVEDFREDLKLVYLYKADRTKQEWERIRKAHRDEQNKKIAQKKKLQDLLGKRGPELAAAYWVNSDALTLNDLKGRFVLLHFYADWHDPSRKDFLQLEQMYQLHGHMVKLIAINAPTPLYRSFFDLNVPIMVDFSEVTPRRGMLGETAFRYGVTRLPYSVLIEPAGVVIIHGALHEVYKKMMGMMLPATPDADRGGAPTTPQLPGAQPAPREKPAS